MGAQTERRPTAPTPSKKRASAKIQGINKRIKKTPPNKNFIKINNLLTKYESRRGTRIVFHRTKHATHAHASTHQRTQTARHNARARPSVFWAPKTQPRHSVTASTAHGHKPRAQPSSKTNQGGRNEREKHAPKGNGGTSEPATRQQENHRNRVP